MKRRFRFDQNAYKVLLLHNQAYWVPIILILACIGVFYLLIIPQYNELQDMRKEEEATRAHIETLQKNVTLLQGLNDTVLDSQFQTVSHVLPSEKDFIGVLNAVSIASANANVSVDDFYFLVGSLIKPQVTGAKQSLQVVFSIRGNINDAKRFIAEMAKQVPLTEIVSSETQSDQTKITALFYYKPYVETTFDSTQLLAPLSQKDTQLISEFESWRSAPVPSPIQPSVTGGPFPSPSVSPSPFPSVSPSAAVEP